MHWNHTTQANVFCKDLGFRIFFSVCMMNVRRTEFCKNRNILLSFPHFYFHVEPLEENRIKQKYFSLISVQPPSERKNSQFSLWRSCWWLQTAAVTWLLINGERRKHSHPHKDTEGEKLCTQPQSGLSYSSRQRRETFLFYSSVAVSFCENLFCCFLRSWQRGCVMRQLCENRKQKI